MQIEQTSERTSVTRTRSSNGSFGMSEKRRQLVAHVLTVAIMLGFFGWVLDRFFKYPAPPNGGEQPAAADG